MPFEYRYQAVVLRIVDGDTIEVKIDMGFHIFSDVPLRIYGINTPEIIGPEAPKGLASKKALEDILPIGQKVLLRTYKPDDKYGRFLAEVLMVKGQEYFNVGNYMIEKGFAKEYYGEGEK